MLKIEELIVGQRVVVDSPEHSANGSKGVIRKVRHLNYSKDPNSADVELEQYPTCYIRFHKSALRVLRPVKKDGSKAPKQAATLKK